MKARDAPLATREIAGYRILRSLARDEQAELLLGHRVVAAADGDGVEGAGGAVIETVALKVIPATAEGWASVLRLGAVLERASGDHIVELRDADADADSIRLVFERLTRGDLASLLALRASWEAGEAVTVLAPVVTTLQRLHAAGVAHGALGPRTLMFRDDGAPTLIGFSAAELFEPGAPEVVLEEVAAVLRDREAARGLAVMVLERVAGPRARAARELLAELADVDSEMLLTFLVTRLFGMAAALPVRFTADEPIPDVATATPRVVPISSAVPWGESGQGAEPDARGALALVLGRFVLGRFVPEPLVQRVLDAVDRSSGAPVVRVLAERWRSWSTGRRRIVLAVGAAALTIAVVTAVLPASGAPSHAASAPMPTGSGSSHSGSAPPRAGDPALSGDDPVAAASALLAGRDRCLAALSVLCLDGVDEVDSGALDGDQAAIRVAQRGGELPDPAVSGAGAGTAVLIERLGDSALVRLGPTASPSSSSAAASPDPMSTPTSGPASLLLVKGEAGWRIRDVIGAGPR